MPPPSTRWDNFIFLFKLVFWGFAIVLVIKFDPGAIHGFLATVAFVSSLLLILIIWRPMVSRLNFGLQWIARRIAWLRPRYGFEDIVQKTGLGQRTLESTAISYREFSIPKRKGGERRISAPDKALKSVQRALLRKVFRGLKVHSACRGFVRGRSIVHHAKAHSGKALVFRVDIKDFFPSISRERLISFYRDMGWDKPSAAWLSDVTSWQGRLPQGAPTSPLLSNAVNYRLDKRLAGLAAKAGADYTRYADDLTFSFDENGADHGKGTDPDLFLAAVYRILNGEGYKVQTRKKVRFMRSHDRQLVTGLVVNKKVALPRLLRRRLRAARHHLRVGRPATWSEGQLKGWASLESMVRKQSAEAAAPDEPLPTHAGRDGAM